VVLQRFRGELVMLDRRGDSSGAPARAGSSAEPAASFERNEMDDEIPF
jgi:hypothetical protein